MAVVGRGLPDHRASRSALYGDRRRDLRRAAGQPRAWPSPARRAVYAHRRADHRRVRRSSRSRSCARTSRSSRSSHALVDDDAVLLQGGRRVVVAGGLAAAVGRGCCRSGRASCCSITRRRMRDVDALRDRRSCSASRAFFVGLLVVHGVAVRHGRGGAPAEGTGLNPLLRHPSMMIHPTAAVLGLHAVRRCRSRSRSAR